MRMSRANLIAILLCCLPAFAGATGIEADRAIMNRARAAYAKGNYAEAEKLYSQIKQSSDYYPLAVEERAHTHGRAGRYNQALADLTTLFSPVFEKSLGPEPYFTAALTHLRLCQYKPIFETIKKYKTNMRDRIVALTELAERKADQRVLDVAANLKARGFNSLSYVREAHLMPTLFHLDHQVRQFIRKGQNAKLLARVAQLAREDLKDIAANTKKMHLVEAEVMQRLHIAENSKDARRGKMGEFTKNADQLTFPYNGEVWIDELDSYQVQAENCPSSKGASS